MKPIEIFLVLMAASVALGMLARHLKVAYPIVLVCGGLILSLQPWMPGPPPLDPDLIFLAILPPLLYAGGFNTEWPEFRHHLRAIVLLAVGLVAFTTVLVSCVAHYYVGLPWAAACVLGAIVSPPDAVAAMAATKHARLPKIVATILEGESLVNDAAALVLYRAALAWAVGGALDASSLPTSFLVVGGGGLLLGVAAGRLVGHLHRWIDRRGLADAKLTITTTLLTPYAVYLGAERLHVSGVLAVVACGLWVGTHAGTIFCREMLTEARSVWEWVEFVLNSAVFMLVGFQLPAVHAELGDAYSPAELAGFALAVTGAAVGARLVWVFPGAYLPRWADRKIWGTGDPYPPWQNVLVVAWTGMRGVVSIACALAIPLTTADGAPFPGRGLILFLTFWVIFGTLVGQGLTLPWLIRRLRVDAKPDNPFAAPPPSG